MKKRILFATLAVFLLATSADSMNLMGRRLGFMGNDAYTKLLLHFDGADGATETVDSSRSAHTIIMVSGAALSNTTAVFGPTAASLGANNHVVTADWTSDFNVGTGDFTFDTRVYIAALPPPAGTRWLFHSYQTSGSEAFAGYLINDSGTYKWRFAAMSNSYEVSIGSISAETWYHVAFVRSGGNLYIFQNGAQVGVAQACADDVSLTPDTGKLGIGNQDAAGYVSNLRIDEVRFSKGIARWTANFTPPTAAYR